MSIMEKKTQRNRKEWKWNKFVKDKYKKRKKLYYEEYTRDRDKKRIR